MARPFKEGLEYFPLDVDIDQDDKLVVPIGKFGTFGFGIIIRLMMAIYKNGYFYGWSEKEQYAFANRINVDINNINEVINECIKWGFFNHELFEKYQILSSSGFQKRFIEASKRRKGITFVKKYSVIDLEEAAKKSSCSITLVNADNNGINVCNNNENIDNNDTKRKRNRKGERNEDISAEISDFRSRYSQDMLMTIDEYLAFIAETRRGKKISDSIVHKALAYFSKYTSNQVEYAILAHMTTESKRSAPENYTFGIVRNSTEEEAVRRLPALRALHGKHADEKGQAAGEHGVSDEEADKIMKELGLL